ncbi:uncharacterized protein LOC122263937 [Penaeus japonicus]|uniref:uncharacterized protein LOC122263937 n=1 Tax=Penaeus japonicus TaxID=27405 RepID=UPI001C7151F8|nr:uncharacterized protein LOC122263937 [Penaeus japonicus]
MLTKGFGQLLRPSRRVICSFHKAKLSSRSACKEDVFMEGREFKWLWPAYREMEMFKAGHDIGCRQGGGRFRYNTVKPLKPEHVEQALRHYQRKTPNCRCFLKEREEKLWVCEDPNPDIDFEYLEGAESNDVIKQLLNEPFFADRTPTWKARLIPVAADAPCLLPEIKAAYPYQYDLVMMPHHSFVDGFTMTFICGKLVELLNDVIAGRPIDDEPYGVFLSNEDIVKIEKQIEQDFLKEPEKLEAMKQELLACDTTPILFKAFPPPGGKPASDRVYRNVDQRTRTSFAKKCKENGVTFNSGLEAVVNMAIIEMVRDAGVEVESHHMSIHLATDVRRYMKPRPLPILGLHSRPTVHRVETPSNVRDNFWDYTRKLHQRLLVLLKSGEALQQLVVRGMTLPTLSPVEYYAAKPEPVRDYAITNLGDLTTIIPGVGEHLQQTDLSMVSNSQYFGFMMLHQLFTFRGNMPYTLTYDMSYMTKDTAVALMDRVLTIMHEFGTSL